MPKKTKNQGARPAPCEASPPSQGAAPRVWRQSTVARDFTLGPDPSGALDFTLGPDPREQFKAHSSARHHCRHSWARHQSLES